MSRRKGSLIFHPVNIEVEQATQSCSHLVFIPVTMTCTEEHTVTETTAVATTATVQSPTIADIEDQISGTGDAMRPLIQLDPTSKVPNVIRQRALDRIFDALLATTDLDRRTAIQEALTIEKALFLRSASKDIYRCELTAVLREISGQ
jgi:hypothetical protein